MGGRPSRPLRLQPTWNVIYRDDYVYMTDDEGEIQGTIAYDIEPMGYHWTEESGQFKKELCRWQRFRACQQKSRHQERLETELELENTDDALIKYLSRLTDWQEFEMYQGHIYADALSFEDQFLEEFLWITNKELPGEVNSEVHRAIRTWLLQMMKCQKRLKEGKKDWDWIKDEWPKIVADVVTSVSRTPKLQSSLEAKFRKQTYAAFNAIQKLGGQPSHDVSPPTQSLDDLQRVLYWSSETSKFMKELSDWKKFLEWRQQKSAGTPTLRGQSYWCPAFESSQDFHAEFEDFRRSEYDIALTWLKCWQRVVRWHEKEKGNPNPAGWVYDYVKVARSHMINSEQKVTDAAVKLEKSIQEHAHARSQHGEPTCGEAKKGSLQIHTQPTPTQSDSGSSGSSFSSSSCLLSPPSTQPLGLSQPEQSFKRPFQDQRSPKKSRSVRKDYRRAKKDDASDREGEMEKVNTNQQALPPSSIPSTRVEMDDDVEMIDVQENQSTVVAMEEVQAPNVEDIMMTDVEDPSPNTACSSKSQARSINKEKSKKMPSSGAPHWKSRETRSTAKLDETLAGKVPKKSGKKPAKKALKFTEDQKLALMNAASASTMESPTEYPSLRRSERLKEKAAAPVVRSFPPTPSPQFDHGHISSSSEHKLPPERLEHVDPSRPSGRRKSKKELNSLEPSQTSRRKKSKIPKPVVEPPRPSRQKKLEKQVRDAARRGS